jgi:hypothetical protein
MQIGLIAFVYFRAAFSWIPPVGDGRPNCFGNIPHDEDSDPDQSPKIALVVPSHHAGLPRHK